MLDYSSERGTRPHDSQKFLDELLAPILRQHFALGQRLGLSCQDLLVLATLRQSGTAAVKQLKRRAAIPPSTLTSVIDRLEQRSLVRRWRPPEDRRSVLLEATAAAVSLLRGYERELLDGVLAGVTPSDRQLLALHIAG